jgi:hypothetical protein
MYKISPKCMYTYRRLVCRFTAVAYYRYYTIFIVILLLAGTDYIIHTSAYCAYPING